MQTAIHTPQGLERQELRHKNTSDQFDQAVEFVREQVIAKIPNVTNENAEIISNLYPFSEWRQVYNHVLSVH